MNVIISAAFKLFPRYEINTFQAIVTNYVVCVITGSLFIGYVPFSAEAAASPWFPWSIVTGVCFIALFNLIGFNTRIHGITTTTIANKLSLVIPVIISIWLYREHTGIAKVAGILLAFPAVYFTSRQKQQDNVQHNLFWPAMLFIGSGLLDTLINYLQRAYLPTAEVQAVFTIHSFAMAAVVGLVTTLVYLRLKKTTIQLKNLLAGVCIGIPNYFSIYFLIRALNSGVLESSATIPVINIGILVASSVTAILLFRERANRMRLFGLALSIIAILLIALG